MDKQQRNTNLHERDQSASGGQSGKSGNASGLREQSTDEGTMPGESLLHESDMDGLRDEDMENDEG